ncbi:MAG: L,D-transpeptidase family protein [Cyclobacteriaceae bacterium]
MKYILLILAFSGFLNPQQQDFSRIFQTQQLIVVTSDTWSTNRGRLSFYELNAENKWKLVLKDIAVMLGRSGMAWGAGLQPTDLNTGTLKHEGDGKSPAGIFKLTRLFSYGEMESSMDYVQADSTLYCVDDVNSAYYNQLVSTRNIDKDWSSAEEMRRTDHQYKFGVVVAYNTEGAKKGAGSCIFLHIWRSPTNSTSGCTSMTESNLLTIMQALDKKKNPVLVQMPVKEYNQLKKIYALP